MYKFQDIIRFKKELYFNGAVQVDWFYNDAKQYDVASSFVFHGPEYFGIDKSEITFKSHRLLDTASFMNVLVDKVYGDSQLSNFFLTIAPYGTGKSHLSVALASFLSGNLKAQGAVLRNLKSVDANIAQQVSKHDLKPNLVLILNGMRDFNLNYEILNATQKTLTAHNIDVEFLKELTRSYDIARVFVENTFDNYQALYKSYSDVLSNTSAKSDLKQYLIENILADTDVFEIINKVYKEINGTYIRWDEGVSAGDVLEKIADKLCGEREPFNKVVLFFDEFGRYIEFASNNPTKASDAALQQIYEAVQNADDKIVFLGFIQSDLKSYLTRVDRTANINRYVGRYESSEKIHLSSNLETIFANLVERKDAKVFKDLVTTKIEKNDSEWQLFHRKFMNWAPEADNSNVWSNYEHFKKVILEGIYPLHPLNSWILSNLSSWLQQRSSLTFLETQINNLADQQVNEFGDLLLVPATRIIRTEFFNELLAAEQEGRKQSEYCILYNQILTKYGDKLDERAKETLAAILISRIGRFKTHSRYESVELVAYAAGISIKEVELAINQLEDQFGVLSYDEVANVFDFIADAIGVNDFKLLLRKKRRNTEVDMSFIFDTGLAEELKLEDIETAFGIKHFIKTREWKFTQKIIHINDMTPRILSKIKMDHLEALEPDKAKGQIIWLYVPNDYNAEMFKTIQQLLKNEKFDSIPVAFFILDDKENKFYEAILDHRVSNSFTQQETDKYRRFILDYQDKAQSVLADAYRELATERLLLTGTTIEKVKQRLNAFTNDLFESLYTRVIPFSYTEFSHATLGKAKKGLSRISRIVLSNAIYQTLHSESADIKGRIESILYQKSVESWAVLNEEYNLIAPKNPKVQSIFSEWDSLLEEKGEFDIQKLFDKYQKVPYGLNDYALSLLVAVFLASRREETKTQLENQRIRLEEWSTKVYVDKNINLKVMFETKVIQVKPEESANKYVNLYKKVVQNSDVSVAKDLYDQFKNLKLEEDIPVELEDKVTNMEILLKEGNRLYDETIKLFGAVKQKLAEAKRKTDDLRGVFEILDTTKTIQNVVGSSDKYIYNEAHLIEARMIEDAAHKYFEETYPIFLKNLKCQSRSQATQFDSWLKKLITSMTNHQYLDEARALKTKKDQVLDNLDPIQDRVNEFVSSSNPKASLGYTKLTDIQLSGDKLLPLIEKSRLADKEKKDSLDSVKQLIEQSKLAIKSLDDEVGQVYSTIYDIQSVKDCEEFFLKVKIILVKDIREMDREGIEEAANHVQNFLNDIPAIKAKQDDRFEVNQEFQLLKDKWTEIESEVDFIQIIENYEKEIQERLNQKEQEWLKQFTVDASILKLWSAEQCTTWLNKVKSTPNYLTDNTLLNLSEFKRLIHTRMKDLNIEAVISLFNDLSEEEKVEAIEKMRTIM
ncbi:hypothetical protein [Psychrobacillus sp. FJAT-21963]|uniref:hypothetical protein n=1 Tax=Psychrobacillus sp. FJAT-21963 TaxID=1712028 RepID=UPI0007008C8F|nr:hypothetical protein [Psychrobacillus sp. FJAT-21963]KQL35264.1 hypothetical protein AN959_10020 [Psychrobacillus sp. FJAT-21963]